MSQNVRDQAGSEGSEHAPTGVARGQFSIRGQSGPWRDVLRRRMLIGGDAVGVLVAGALAGSGAGSPRLLWTVGLLPMWLVLAKLNGLYDADHRALRHLTVDELGAIAAWAATGTATEVLILTSATDEGVSALGAMRLFALAGLVCTPLRGAVRLAWRRRVPHERALLIGSGPLATATRRKLELFEDIHVICVAQVDDPRVAHDLEERIIEADRIDRVIVASHEITEVMIAQQVTICRRRGLKLSVVPPARSMFGTAVQLHHIADLPMIEYSTWDTARSTALLKRAIDLLVSAAALVVLAPLLVVAAGFVRLDSRGPAFFVQRRAGVGGVPFAMVKLRTMRADAEERLVDIVDIEALADPVFKLQRDPRVTRVGRVLRRTSLDELPQLINVLRGEMSMVGPRPEQLDLVERYEPEDRFRLAVRPGLTGPMQVYGRGRLGFEERLAVEREYIENLSLARDLRIVLLTFAAVALGRGAF